MPALFAGLDRLIDAAPEASPLEDWNETTPRETPGLIPFIGNTIAEKTGTPGRYRAPWERPTDEAWQNHFARVSACISSGGIIGLIGNRGTGKTRLAAEVMRDHDRIFGRYTTAMGLFLRIRSTYGKKGSESEASIVEELSKAPLLILDEIQERGNTEWEDRLLTHVLDARYGEMRPTILIANLTREALRNQLGESINSRLIETGGILEMTGPSHRVKP
jgi:DNA replication protein DnaC